MSTERDVTRIVRSWLEEGATALPDRVLDAVLDQVPTTSQRRPWWPAWRLNDMNTAFKVAIAGLAVFVIAVAGHQPDAETDCGRRTGGDTDSDHRHPRRRRS